MTNITRLSPEIILEIMELLDLSDICTLIKTSSLFLQQFLTHRKQLLKSTVNNLKHRLAGCNFSIFLSALRLRCRQPISAPSSQSEVKEAEQANLRLYRTKMPEISFLQRLSCALFSAHDNFLLSWSGLWTAMRLKPGTSCRIRR